MQSLTKEEVGGQSLSQIPQGPYRDLLAKYPKLLEQNFKSEDPKNGIIHRIRTGTHPPTRAKARKLLPGSPKAEDDVGTAGLISPAAKAAAEGKDPPEAAAADMRL